MKVLIAEDHALFREALGGLLAQILPDVKIIEAATYQDIFSVFEQGENIDFLILDIGLPDLKWEDGISKLRNLNSNVKIIIVSASDDIKTIRKASEYNIVGYIGKSFSPKILTCALKIIFEGGTYAPISAVSSVEKSSQAQSQSLRHNLTQRQEQVLRLVGEGKSNKQIAYEMQVSEATVKLHINALLRSLGVTNRTQAVITAQKMGLI